MAWPLREACGGPGSLPAPPGKRPAGLAALWESPSSQDGVPAAGESEADKHRHHFSLWHNIEEVLGVDSASTSAGSSDTQMALEEGYLAKEADYVTQGQWRWVYAAVLAGSAAVILACFVILYSWDMHPATVMMVYYFAVAAAVCLLLVSCLWCRHHCCLHSRRYSEHAETNTSQEVARSVEILERGITLPVTAEVEIPTRCKQYVASSLSPQTSPGPGGSETVPSWWQRLEAAPGPRVVARSRHWEEDDDLMFLDTGSSESRSVPKVTCLGRPRSPKCGASALPTSRRAAARDEAAVLQALPEAASVPAAAVPERGGSGLRDVAEERDVCLSDLLVLCQPVPRGRHDDAMKEWQWHVEDGT
eukprot:TRINITY_DN20280_c0_g1_i3.p1 TRINITY_DN20280_c0_g1~~TRINITY_DN20280_c0_g1_i3.p1  ORF type:complete len:393 (+),score=49.01 TRINITY_DN20280_c0_g1_i3:94-1179(+)